MIDGSEIKQGDRILHMGGRGVILMTGANYVRIKWDKYRKPDVLFRNSPLWHHLELDK